MTGWTVVQIFDGSKLTPMEVSLTDDKVEDVIRRIPNGEDVYVTMHGRTLKRSEKLNSCGVSDGCTIQLTNRMRGREHMDKKSNAEKKQATSQKSVSNEGPAILEREKETVIRMWEENGVGNH